MAGSNALFGLDNSILEKETGFSVIKMGIHAAIPLEYLEMYTMPFVKAGDIVLIPLEWEYYTITEMNSHWMRKNMFYWYSFI